MIPFALPNKNKCAYATSNDVCNWFTYTTLSALGLTSNFPTTRKYFLCTMVIDLLYSVVAESDFPMSKLKAGYISISFLFSILLYKGKQVFIFLFSVN